MNNTNAVIARPAAVALMAPAWVFWGLVLPLIAYAIHMVHVLTRAEIPFDSVHTYLPLARQLIADPSLLFSNPDSYKVAPGAVVYMALAGADPVSIKAANLGISLTALVMTFDAARRIGGPVAAVSAGWLYALPHMLVEGGAALLGEAPFIFLVALWLWATAVAVQTQTTELATTRWHKGAVLLAGLALSAATLTRATYMYWLPFAAVTFFAASLRLKDSRREAALRIVAIHLIATLLVGAYVLRQQKVFGQPMVATGSGAAIYFGSNAVLSGYEPPYFGLGHDETTVTDNLAHLSIEGNRRLISVSKKMLADLPVRALLGMYVQKLGAFLFFSRAHLERQVMNDRGWRIVLVVLALVGMWGARGKVMTWLIGGAAVYQCAVHVPVLYNPRYSISALDVILVLLAAQGVAWLWNRKQRGIAVGCTSLILAGGVAAGALHQRHSRPLMPDFEHFPAIPVKVAKKSELKVRGWSGNPFDTLSSIVSRSAQVEWLPDKLEQNRIAIFHLAVPRFEGRCKNAWLTHVLAGDTRTARISLEGFDQGQDVNWGMTFIQLPGEGNSRLTLHFECDAGTRMQFGELGVYRASPGERFRDTAFPQLNGSK